jgi:diaminopimelate decarboxylase
LFYRDRWKVESIVPRLPPPRMRVVLEPGRFLVGNAGVLLTRVLYCKKTPNKVFIIVDVGMNDLSPGPSPGYHEIVPFNESANKIRADVVGPVCESGDFIVLDREIADAKAGDMLAIMSAGVRVFHSIKLQLPTATAVGGGIGARKNSSAHSPPAKLCRPDAA